MERTWKPTTAGILTIIAGSGVIGGGVALLGGLLFLGGILAGRLVEPAIGWRSDVLAGIISAVLIGLGVLAIVGGVFALRRKLWGLALAGAIFASRQLLYASQGSMESQALVWGIRDALLVALVIGSLGVFTSLIRGKQKATL